MANYIDQVGSTYYFHRSIPKAVRPYVQSGTGNPRVDFKVTLGTKDRDTAKARIPFYVIETDRIFKEARKRMAAGEAPSVDTGLTLSAMPTGQPRPVSEFDPLEQVSDEYEDWADYWEKCLTREQDWLSIKEAAGVDMIRQFTQQSAPNVMTTHTGPNQSWMKIRGSRQVNWRRNQMRLSNISHCVTDLGLLTVSSIIAGWGILACEKCSRN